MHSIYVRIFMLFWVAMALIVGGSIAITFAITAHEYEAPDLQRRPPVAVRAAEVLSQGGLGALRHWLEVNKSSLPGRDLYVIGPDGADILGRRLSESAVRRMEYFNRDELAGRDADGAARDAGGPAPHDLPPREPPRIYGTQRSGRAARATPFITAPDGTLYTVLVAPRRPSIFGALSLPEISLTILCIALLVSALASGWLARHLSAPIRRIQEGARALATENLDIRVSAGLEGRRDEVAVLARDFDAMAEQLRANRAATTRLLRDISHELRSPLARMRVALGLARQPAADTVRQLDRLEREVERLDALISQVLKLARLQGNDASFVPETFDLDELLEEIAHDAGFEGAAKGTTIVRNSSPAHPASEPASPAARAAAHPAASPAVPTAHPAARAAPLGHPDTVHAPAAPVLVRGSRDLLRSGIENVLRNAVRYSPPNTPVEMDLLRAAGSVTLVIRDHGGGVPAGDLERIFQPFYRVAEARDRDSGGEGIGLAITAQVMRTHGGTARAANIEGGFEVRLTLPTAPAPA